MPKYKPATLAGVHLLEQPTGALGHCGSPMCCVSAQDSPREDPRTQFASHCSRTPRLALPCVLVSTTAQLQANSFVRGTHVRLVEDIPGYTSGSSGKIAVANGLAWTRYWVRFDDGKAIGHIDHKSLVRQRDYEEFLAARRQEELEAAEAAELAAAAVETTDADTASASDAGGRVQVNGVTIPQRLLDMSAAARKRLEP